MLTEMKCYEPYLPWLCASAILLAFELCILTNWRLHLYLKKLKLDFRIENICTHTANEISFPCKYPISMFRWRLNLEFCLFMHFIKLPKRSANVVRLWHLKCILIQFRFCIRCSQHRRSHSNSSNSHLNNSGCLSFRQETWTAFLIYGCCPNLGAANDINVYTADYPPYPHVRTVHRPPHTHTHTPHFRRLLNYNYRVCQGRLSAIHAHRLYICTEI